MRPKANIKSSEVPLRATVGLTAIKTASVGLGKSGVHGEVGSPGTSHVTGKSLDTDLSRDSRFQVLSHVLKHGTQVDRFKHWLI